MRTKFIFALFLFAALQFNCTEKKVKNSATHNPDSTEQHTFFPVTSYILGQLREIDSMPVTPVKIITRNGKDDSIWMKKEDIRTFAEPFLHPKIDTENFKNLFKESSFLDQTINAITFTYDPIDNLPDTLQLRHWDVYVDPQKNTVNRIYLVKKIVSNNITQTMQLTWQSYKWCRIITITEAPGKASEIKEETMKWDFTE